MLSRKSAVIKAKQDIYSSLVQRNSYVRYFLLSLRTKLFRCGRVHEIVNGFYADALKVYTEPSLMLIVNYASVRDGDRRAL